MSSGAIIEGLISYLCLIILITFHEFGHAWMAWKRGDDTARLLGRISLNPVVHMEFIGTVVLPLLGIYLSSVGSAASSYVIGWGKPVPVNSANLKNRGFDWVLVAMAGPAMNVILGVVSVALVRAAMGMDSSSLFEFGVRLAFMNFMLCYFNLIPIPPLDGSHVMRYFIGMSEETFLRISQYGFFVLIIVLQIPGLRRVLSNLTTETVFFLMRLFGVN